jgi:electron transfer flavoprotein alpha subunit
MKETLKALIFAEHRDGQLKKSAREVLSAARALADVSGGSVGAVVLGPGAEGAVPELHAWGARGIWWADAPGLTPYAPLCWLRALTAVVEQARATAVLLSASSLGRDLAPRLAARLGGVFASDVLELRCAEQALQIVRPVLGGRFLETVQPAAAPAILTLRPNVFPARKPPNPAAGRVERLDLPDFPADLRAVVRSISVPDGSRKDLTEAEIVVCGGRGLGSRENFRLVHELADALGAAAGASRAAVDAGFAPPALQIGQSGKTVSPRLYLALGISGSLQHLAGMRTSRCVVAVNRDPRAPIFKWTDYAVVGDALEIVPALIAALKIGAGH